MRDVKFFFREFQAPISGKLINMKISFDFDFTLSETEIQLLCKTLNNDPNNEIFCITSRSSEVMFNSNPNKALFNVCDSLDIKKENIIFTNGLEKHIFLTKHNIDIHFDDDIIEKEQAEINKCKTIIILIK